MQLLEPDKMRARIHQGAPVLGVQDSGFALGYRFEQIMGLFEYRMNNIQPWEYTRIVGIPAAAQAVLGTIQVGSTIGCTVAALSPVVYTVQSADLTAPDPTFSAVQNFCNAFNAAHGSSFIASPQPAVVWPQTTVSAGPKQWQIAFVSSTTAAFTIAPTGTNGLLAYVVSQGNTPNPSAAFKEDAVTAVGYLSICDYLEGKIATSSDLMKFSKADVVGFRPDEMDARDNLYQYWRQRLADVWGIPLYPMGGTGGMATGFSV